MWKKCVVLKNKKALLRLRSKAFSVVPGGFEPPQTEPKTVVLPLHHRTIVSAKVIKNSFAAKFFGLFHCDEIIILLAALHEKILAVDEVFGCNYTVEGCELLLVERYATTLNELAHLAL